ncbi:MAG: hypothetical protein ABL970_18070 [Nitrospira sp.]
MASTSTSYRVDELEYLAGHCTKKEDDAERVERQLRKSAAALLLEPLIGHKFDAIVTEASSKGTWVRLLDPPVEGKRTTGTTGLDAGDTVHVERGYIVLSKLGDNPEPGTNSEHSDTHHPPKDMDQDGHLGT